MNSNSTSSQRTTRNPSVKRGIAVNSGSPRHENGDAGSLLDDREMLWRLVDEAETNLVAYSEEVFLFFVIALFLWVYIAF